MADEGEDEEDESESESENDYLKKIYQKAMQNEQFLWC